MRAVNPDLSGPRRNRGAVTRAATILIVCVCVLAVVIAIPIYIGYKDQAADYACSLAVDKAQDYMDIYYLDSNYTLTLEDAQEAINDSLIERENLCPDGGEFFVLEDEEREQPYIVVCGLHDSDAKERTRLCAKAVLPRIQKAVRLARYLGDEYPESVTITLNSRELTAYLVDEETGLRRGTFSTSGYDGIVAYYGLVGHSEFGADSGLTDGEVFYLSYADEDHCANWSATDGWTGDSYRD